MKYLLTGTFILLGFVASVKAQECPADKVCISPEAARKAITDDATVKAQAVQIKDLQQAVLDEKANTHKIEVQFAEVSGENTALKQNAVSDRAIIEVLLKNSKKKCMPFSILCL